MNDQDDKTAQPELSWLKGLGPRRAAALAESGIHTRRQLLYFFPRAYIDRSSVMTINELRRKGSDTHKTLAMNFAEAAEVNVATEYTVVGTVALQKVRKVNSGKELLILELDDGSGSRAELVFFRQTAYFKKQYPPGSILAVSGLPEVNKYGKVSFAHPDIERIEEEDVEDYSSGKLLPKYSMSQKMIQAGITMRLLRKVMADLLEADLWRYREALPSHLLQKYNLMSLQEVIRALHFPRSMVEVQAARVRMKYEELLHFEIVLSLRHRGMKVREKAPVCDKKSLLARRLVDELPFALTNAQKRVIREVAVDMSSGQPMNRLLQGDVGSGKTIVALLSMLVAIDNGLQCVLMAPTEILAEQHYQSILPWCEKLGLTCVSLFGGMRASMRKQRLQAIASGEANIVVGTHALFQESVAYNKLGFVVVDEQHRFGVLQRAALKQRAAESFAAGEEYSPHILVMSATPIPRTLSMTVYGDLDVSVIDELPKNRKPIRTKVVFERELPEVYQFIDNEIASGRQAYIVYPLVEESEKIELKSAVERHEALSTEIFPHRKVGLLHGQMLWYEKEDAMVAFKNKEYDILVATTVVEVGIDVPNATVILIEHADRFGLAQLHQLRGRVGRGAEQSYCLLATKDHFKFHISRQEKELAEAKSAIVRLRTMEQTNDGFKVAEVDMTLRGPGDVMGTRQSGMPKFDFADLLTDGPIIEKAREDAKKIVEDDPHLRRPEHLAIREKIVSSFSSDVQFLDIA